MAARKQDRDRPGQRDFVDTRDEDRSRRLMTPLDTIFHVQIVDRTLVSVLNERNQAEHLIRAIFIATPTVDPGR